MTPRAGVTNMAAIRSPITMSGHAELVTKTPAAAKSTPALGHARGGGEVSVFPAPVIGIMFFGEWRHDAKEPWPPPSPGRDWRRHGHPHGRAHHEPRRQREHRHHMDGRPEADRVGDKAGE